MDQPDFEIKGFEKTKAKEGGSVPWEEESDRAFQPSKAKAAWSSPKGVSLAVAFDLALNHVEQLVKK